MVSLILKETLFDLLGVVTIVVVVTEIKSDQIVFIKNRNSNTVGLI